MKKYLIAFLGLLIFPLLVWATVDTWDGQTQIDTWDGQTQIDTSDGVVHVAAGGCAGDYGITTEGESYKDQGGGATFLVKITFDCSDTIDTVHAYCRSVYNDGNHDIRFVIYDDDGAGAQPGTLLGQGDVVNSNQASDGFFWVTDNAAGLQIAVSAGDYWVGFCTEISATKASYTSSTGGDTCMEDGIGLTPDTPWDPSDDAEGVEQLQVYVSF